MDDYNRLDTTLNSHSCRICLEEDNVDNMIYPCKCKGTTKYVHKHCLNEWRTTSENRDNFKRCEMCHYEYKIINEPLNESFCSKILRYLSSQFFAFYLFYSMLVFLFGQMFYYIDDKKEIYSTITFNNATETIDNVKPFYYLFTGFNIFVLQFMLIGYWFLKAKNKKLYCDLYNNSKTLICNSSVIMIISGFLFGWLFALLFLELISLRIFQIHFISIDLLHKVNNLYIENYIEQENRIEIQQNTGAEKENYSPEIIVYNGIEIANI